MSYKLDLYVTNYTVGVKGKMIKRWKIYFTNRIDRKSNYWILPKKRIIILMNNIGSELIQIIIDS